MLLLLFISCEYQPKGLFEVEVNPITEAPSLQFELNINSDTLYIPFDKYITLKYSTPDTLVRYAFFSLNNSQLAKVEQNTGVFVTSFSSTNYQSNTAYKLKIELFRSTGSKSLGDMLQTEGFLYSKEITVFFEDFNGTGNIPFILSATPANGSLKITWKKYKGIGFKRYIVWRGPDKIQEIYEDPNNNSCFDPGFIGYQTAYQVITETEFESFRSPLFIFQDQLPQIQLKKLDDERILLHWGRSKYEANITGYKIIEGFEILDQKLNEIGSFDTNSKDTSLIYSDGKFGAKSIFFLMPVRKEEPQIIKYRSDLESYGTKTDYYYFGIPVNGGWDMKAPYGEFAYYSGTNGMTNYWYKYNCNTRQVVDSTEFANGQTAISPDGKTALMGGYRSLSILNSADLSVTKTISVSQLTNLSLYDGLYAFDLANNGTGIYIETSGDYIFYDFLNEKELARFRISGSTNPEDQREISGDGKYFCLRHILGFWPSYSTELYQLKNGTVTKLWTDIEVKYFEFDQQSNNMSFLKNGKLYFMSLADQKITAEIAVADPYFHDIDWTNREFLTLNETRDMLSIYDLDTGKLKAQKKTLSYDSSEIVFQTLKLFNHTLFSANLRMHLND